jgi:hypothetical protein
MKKQIETKPTLKGFAEWLEKKSEKQPMKKRNLPKEILVYQCDEVEGHPVWAVAVNLDDIPEEFSGQKIATYEIKRRSTFVVFRDLTEA